MHERQRILPVRRDYNRWVADETLEDFALRFTAKRARKWSASRVAQTALGAISFLALEAIGGSVTLKFGFVNALWATLVVSAILFLTGLPICRYAARYGVDIDLLTRGAGFGYIGSTVTSLVYATFTFILFAIEASIMASALNLTLSLPLAWGYLVSAVAVVPLVTHGIAWISRFQLFTQPLWIVLNLLPIGFIAAGDGSALRDWTSFPGLGATAGGFDLLKFGGAASVILALMPQIGEQVDVLRFLPARKPGREPRWAASLLAAGPGWIVLGAPKLMLGSLLAVLCLKAGVPAEHAAEPAQMYRFAFGSVSPWPQAAALMTATFVVVSQLKINVMNAYAGSLAWSNFFSRLTHSHPGRVVWLAFNVAIALLLMELGIYTALERVLSLFAVVAVSWLGAIVADLAINKPLGLSPPGIEFKRAHLYDVNPVGTGAMALAVLVALSAAAGWFGAVPQALAPFVALAVALATAPALAWVTGGRFYLARKPRNAWSRRPAIACGVCGNSFEPEDMAYCPAYATPICSLCCSLDARCHDLCKPHARARHQLSGAVRALLPGLVESRAGRSTVRYLAVFTPIVATIGLVLLLIHVQAAGHGPDIEAVVDRLLWGAFAILVIVSGVLAWFFVLSAESRRVAQMESARQTTSLFQEIEAHKRTDAALQKAKDVAEAANLAKSRYVVGLSHELRTPLNAVLGYAQLLEREPGNSATHRNGVRVIRRSAEHLSSLIDGLLDVSKIEAGRLQIQRNEVRTAAFFDGLADMFRLQAAAKGLAFRFDGRERLPPVVRMDEKRVRQVLINLLSNAIKFTRTGSVGLSISYRNQIATLTVEDTGVGIKPGDLGRVFEPFDRGTITDAVPGLGLGLTIAKLLCELMGGEITVTSTPGAGTAFRVRLMLAAGVSPPPKVARNVSGFAGARRTLLVVDDDQDHQALMRALLEPLGFAVISARDGATALALVGEMQPDLVLLDVSMPGPNGWEIARALRDLRKLTAPIVMLSANVGEGVPASDAPDAVLAKPFDVSRLLDTLKALLNLEWIEQAPASRPPPPAAVGGCPSPALVAELRRFAAIGYVRGLEASLERLSETPDCDALAGCLRDRVRAFDFAGIAALLADFDAEAAP